jgi:hypothetical protein
MQPVPLQEMDKIKTPEKYLTSPPWRCDFDGRLYVRIRSWAGTQVARFSRTQVPDQFFPVQSPVPQLKNFVIIDYGPEVHGGIYALVGRTGGDEPGQRFRIAYFDAGGAFKGSFAMKELTPSKLAVFANGNLLVSGPQLDKSGLESDSWFTGIFAPDGSLQTKIEIDLGHVFSRSPEEKDRHKTTEVKSEDTLDAINFVSSPNGNVYGAVIASSDSPALGSQTRIAEVAPTGEVRLYEMPSQKDSQLFRIVVGANRLLALSGTKDGEVNELREFFINQATHTLDLLGRYRVLGSPQCISDDGLLVIRPDGKGHEYLVTYKH